MTHMGFPSEMAAWSLMAFLVCAAFAYARWEWKHGAEKVRRRHEADRFAASLRMYHDQD